MFHNLATAKFDKTSDSLGLDFSAPWWAAALPPLISSTTARWGLW